MSTTATTSFPLGFAHDFLMLNESATAVLVFRHKGAHFALASI